MSTSETTSPKGATREWVAGHGYWRSFRTATWLGWQIESNWTDPFLFAIYSFVKPISTAAILVIMYGIITQGDFESPIFTYMYLGNAFYIYVGAVMAGVSWAVIDDREHYKTLKYMYVAPIHIPMYLFGRGVAKFIVGSISVLITLVFGMLFLHLRIELAAVNWPLFFGALGIGVIMLAMMGLILAGVTLLIAHHVWFLGEAVAGALYLFSGAIFPLEVLPPAIRWIGYVNPITYWLELIRRAIVGEVADAFPTLANLGNEQILGILIGLTIIFAVLAKFVFRWAEHRARERGLIDMVTNY
ncbi:MAG TPA: ABC transporter permease [Anaerolineales bacterium]|jgi:ABC-2 type transport system permease protein|nr:ABC transporter permease [Anaerolineales bacterium]